MRLLCSLGPRATGPLAHAFRWHCWSRPHTLQSSTVVGFVCKLLSDLLWYWSVCSSSISKIYVLDRFNRLWKSLPSVHLSPFIILICKEMTFFIKTGPSWSWWYGSWIFNSLYKQCLSPLTWWVRITLRWGVLNTTLCGKVCQWLNSSVIFSGYSAFLHQ